MTTEVNHLVKACGGCVELVKGSGSDIVTSVEYDSRRVAQGSLFVAVEGFQDDGHRFIEGALAKGAAALAVSRIRAEEIMARSDDSVAIIAADDTRKALSRLSAAFYGFPSRDLTVIGITGTNGKTSITYMLESIMKAQGRNPGVMGTINYRWKDTLAAAANTTPESRDIQEILYKMKMDGVDTVIMEISSHALDLCRADDIDLDVAVFTNLTRDHLDFHRDFESYFAAKIKIFNILDSGTGKKRCGIVNIDDPYGRRIFDGRKGAAIPTVSFGLDSGADYAPDPASIINDISGLRYRLARPKQGVQVDLQLAGTFHVYNSLAAIASAHRLDVPFSVIQEGLASLKTVPGRFDVLRSRKGFSVIVDYAHTVDALDKLLQSVNEMKPSRVITVFGCGGDRDTTKRPLMGRVAEERSDIVIVTSDNPRTEKPEDIIRDITAGFKGSKYHVVTAREEAIKEAVSQAREGDIVVIAGKGHEDYQILGKEKIHFDDREMAAKYMGEAI